MRKLRVVIKYKRPSFFALSPTFQETLLEGEDKSKRKLKPKERLELFSPRVKDSIQDFHRIRNQRVKAAIAKILS